MVSRAFRAKLAQLCLDESRRINGPNKSVPHDWRPQTVRYPDCYLCFTEAAAWEFIADCLQDDAVTVSIKRPVPPLQVDAYEIIVPTTTDPRPIYMKVAFISATYEDDELVVGISFHYSKMEYSR